jgi:hypothetical protein
MLARRLEASPTRTQQHEAHQHQVGAEPDVHVLSEAPQKAGLGEPLHHAEHTLQEDQRLPVKVLQHLFKRLHFEPVDYEQRERGRDDGHCRRNDLNR